MCGIGGIISNKKRPVNELEALSQLIAHRGPDDEGYLIVEGQDFIPQKGDSTIPELTPLEHIRNAEKQDFSLGLVHRRLSILDLSDRGHQPMYLDKMQLAITFNGEIYNYKELRQELVKCGHKFTSNTDTEVILLAYKEWGQKCSEKLNGMWAFAIYDGKKELLFISRDRFGIKPLYYAAKSGLFMFCSEIKPIVQHPTIGNKIHETNTLEYIAFGKTSNPNASLFKHIKELEPSHNMTLNINTLEIKKWSYYNLEQRVRQFSLPHINTVEHYKELLASSVKAHLQSDVEVGINLSGGLDSSALVGFSAPILDKLNTFTASYSDNAVDETKYASLVSDSFPHITPHYTHPDIHDFAETIDQLVLTQENPIGSTSIFAQWKVMELVAKNKTKVVLSGQGADEVLGGYFNFGGIYLIELLKSLNIPQFLREYKALEKNLDTSMVHQLARAYYYFLPNYIQLILRQRERSGPTIIHSEFHAKLKQLTVPQRGGRSYKESSLLAVKHGLHRLLSYEDRNSMAHSVESRVPFLDHQLVEYSIALNNTEKMRNGWSKYILRKSMEGKVPDSVTWRKGKKGFLTPQKEWKEHLSPYILEYIHSSKIPSFINRDFLLRSFQTNHSNAASLTEYWRLFLFIKWFNLFSIEE